MWRGWIRRGIRFEGSVEGWSGLWTGDEEGRLMDALVLTFKGYLGRWS